MPLATEEMIRWVTPVKEFMRTATRRCSTNRSASMLAEAGGERC